MHENSDEVAAQPGDRQLKFSHAIFIDGKRYPLFISFTLLSLDKVNIISTCSPVGHRVCAASSTA
jgi:hypothetical protein